MNRRSTRRQRVGALGLASLLLAAACSGDDDATPTTPPTSTVTTTTASTSTTTEPTLPPTTERPSTTSAPTTAATTPPTSANVTLPENITPEQFEQIRSDVVAASVEAAVLFDAVRRDPSNPELLAEMPTLMTAERIENIRERFIVPYIANSLVERPNPEIPTAFEARPETFEFDLRAGTAKFEACYISSNVLVQVGGAADGTDEIQDDRLAAVLVERHMTFRDGKWLDDGGFDLEILEGETTCA